LSRPAWMSSASSSASCTYNGERLRLSTTVTAPVIARTIRAVHQSRLDRAAPPGGGANSLDSRTAMRPVLRRRGKIPRPPPPPRQNDPDQGKGGGDAGRQAGNSTGQAGKGGVNGGEAGPGLGLRDTAPHQRRVGVLLRHSTRAEQPAELGAEQ